MNETHKSDCNEKLHLGVLIFFPYFLVHVISYLKRYTNKKQEWSEWVSLNMCTKKDIYSKRGLQGKGNSDIWWEDEVKLVYV